MTATLSQPRPTTPTRPVPLPGKCVPSGHGLYRLPDVTLFAAGEHEDMLGRRRYYDSDFLRQLADNFHALKADEDNHHEPPAVLGHELLQAEMAALSGDPVMKAVMAALPPTDGGGAARTGAPAAGWPDNVRVSDDGRRLVCDLEKIPEPVKALIDSEQVRFPSVEISHNFERPDKTKLGPVLYRVALLGGVPPACKNVPPLGRSHFAGSLDAVKGLYYFADGGAAVAAQSTFRDTVLALVKQEMPDLTDDFLNSLSDDQLNMLGQGAIQAEAAEPEQDAGAGATTAAADSGATKPTTPDQYAGMSHEELVKAAVAAGLDQATADGMADGELRKWLAENANSGTTAMSGKLPTKPAARPARAALPDVNVFAAEVVKQVRAELDPLSVRIKADGDRALKAIGDREQQERRAKIDAFCQEMLHAGKLKGWELDESDTKTAHLSQRQRLYAIRPDETVTLAFAGADGKPAVKDRLEVEMDAIRTRQMSAFTGEALGGDGRAKPDPHADVVERAKKHAEDQNRRMRGHQNN